MHYIINCTSVQCIFNVCITSRLFRRTCSSSSNIFRQSALIRIVRHLLVLLFVTHISRIVRSFLRACSSAHSITSVQYSNSFQCLPPTSPGISEVSAWIKHRPSVILHRSMRQDYFGAVDRSFSYTDRGGGAGRQVRTARAIRQCQDDSFYQERGSM